MLPDHCPQIVHELVPAPHQAPLVREIPCRRLQKLAGWRPPRQRSPCTPRLALEEMRIGRTGIELVHPRGFGAVVYLAQELEFPGRRPAVLGHAECVEVEGGRAVMPRLQRLERDRVSEPRDVGPPAPGAPHAANLAHDEPRRVKHGAAVRVAPLQSRLADSVLATDDERLVGEAGEELEANIVISGPPDR